MSLSRRVRFAVLKRDDFRCQYCGAVAPSVTLEVDHVLARANGGNDEMEVASQDGFLQTIIDDPFLASLYGEIVV